MLLTTDPVLVMGIAAWDIDGEGVTRQDGSPVKYVQIADTDDDRLPRLTIGPNVPEETFPAPGETVVLRLDAHTAQTSGRDGVVREKYKFTVQAFDRPTNGRTRTAAGSASGKSEE